MTLAEIKSQLSMETVLAHYGIEVDKHDRALCPFHDDTRPSLQVYPKSNTVYCFSTACHHHGKALDVIDFVMHLENCTKHEAILKCKQLIDPSQSSSSGRSSNISMSGDSRDEQSKKEVTEAVVYQYFWESARKGFSSSPKAQSYLKERMLDASGLDVGYLAHKIPSYWTEEVKEKARLMGLITEHGVRYNTCLLFQLLDEKGKMVSFYGRKLSTSSNQRHYHPSGAMQGLYPKFPSRSCKRLIFTEGVLDAATLGQYYQNADTEILALFGTNGFTSDHEKVLRNWEKLEEVVLFLDGDEAGRKASLKLKERIKTIHPKLKVLLVYTPDNEDVNSLVQSHSAEVLAGLIAEATGELSLSSDEKRLHTERSRSAHTKIEADLSKTDSGNLVYKTSTAVYHILGSLPQSADSMKVRLHIEDIATRKRSRKNVELYEDASISKTAKESAEKLHLEASLIESDLDRLADLLQEYRENEKPVLGNPPVAEKLSRSVQTQIEQFGKHPDLLDRLNEKIELAGIVGEEKNRLFLFLVAASYKMPETLHALIQGSSGSGKTHLLKAIVSLMPEESGFCFTRLTDSSLYNYGAYGLVNKLLAFEDLDGLSEEALYALRELISSDKLSSLVSAADVKGNHESVNKLVYGPIATLACTTKGSVYEDNMSRCFLIAVDESETQTNRVIDFQNRKAAGLVDAKTLKDNQLFLQNFIRALKSLEVINPYAHLVKLPPEAHKIRRLNDLYQRFVRQIVLVHQFQRKKDNQGRLIAEKSDLLQACNIMLESIILKVDELDGSLRQFYERLKIHATEQCTERRITTEKFEFTQREIRQGLKLSKSQTQRSLNNLLEMEYLCISGGYANKGYLYRICYWDAFDRIRSHVKTFLQDQIDQL